MRGGVRGKVEKEGIWGKKGGWYFLFLFFIFCFGDSISEVVVGGRVRNFFFYLIFWNFCLICCVRVGWLLV